MGEDIQSREGTTSEEGESVASNPSTRRHTVKEQELRDKERHKREGSAYWDSLPDNEEGQKIEPIEANPDLVADDREVYATEREEYGEKLHHVRLVMKKHLSPREFQVMQLLQEGFTYDKIALNMGIQKGTVQILVARARQKLVTHLSHE